LNGSAPRHPVSIFFGRDRGMVFFLAFLVLTTIIVPMVTLSQIGRLALSLIFALTLIFGAFATIQHRIAIYFVIGLTMATFAVDLISEIGSWHSPPGLDTPLKMACLAILFFMSLKVTLLPV